MGDLVFREGLDAVVSRLEERSEAGVRAMVEDGWPEELARAGIADHLETWDSRAIARAVAWEIDRGEDSSRSLERIWRPPDSVAHLWPALPGAGVTPVLFGGAVGANQWIRPSRRCAHFADWFERCWQQVDVEDWPSIEMMSPEETGVEELSEAVGSGLQAVVVSGNDDTVAQVRSDVHDWSNERADQRVTVTGYGHRLSFAVVPPAEAMLSGADIGVESAAERIARDVVMWHQSGCFSVRAVFVAGGEERRDVWAEAIGEAIVGWENHWDAEPTDAAALDARAARKGLADFEGTRRPAESDGFGFADICDASWSLPSDEPDVPHVVEVYSIPAEPAGLAEAIDVPARHLQAGALAGLPVYSEWGSKHLRRWIGALTDLGLTRVAPIGELQRPPAGWLHDGMSNVDGWGRWTTVTAQPDRR